MSNPKITLHYIPIPASRVERIVWLLEELDLKYDVKAHPMVGPTSPGMKAVSKLGKLVWGSMTISLLGINVKFEDSRLCEAYGNTPALEVDGRVLTETGFIVHYLLQRFPHAGLESSPSDPSYFWSHFSEGTMMLHLQPGRLLGIAQGALPKKPGTTVEQGQGIDTLGNWLRNGWVKKNVTLQLAEVEAFLAANANFSGSDLLGEGDIMMAYPLNSIANTPVFGKFDVGPKTIQWLDRIRARPAYGRAMERLTDEGAKAAKPKL